LNELKSKGWGRKNPNCKPKRCG